MGIVDLLAEHPVLVGLPAVLVLYLTLSTFTAKPIKLPELPSVGDGAGFLATFSNGRKWLTEGYEIFGKSAKTFIFPDANGTKHIMLPNEKSQWILDHPDDQLSVGAAHYDTLAGDFAFTDPAILRILYHEHVIHRNLARKLKDIIPHMWDEVSSSFDDIWGTDTETWKEAVVYQNVSDMVARISNRLFVGFPLCRDDKFLKIMASFAQDVINTMIVNQLVPNLLKPIVMPLIAAPNHYHWWQSSKFTLPIIQQRLADIEEMERNPNAKIDIPEDYFTWHIRLAKAEGKSKELTPDFISRAVLAIEFAALHTTTISGTAILLDLASSKPEDGVLQGISEEVERVYREEGGFTTKQALNKLVRIDSALRESMRLLDLVPFVARKVVAPDGVRNAEEGWHAPCGAYISFNSQDRHHDADLYPNPYTYDAFRFSRPREAYEASNPTEKQGMEYLKLQNTSFTSTSENFLPFGHGRHACPGRFFVQQELKMIIAYLILNYDIEPLAKRPEVQRFGMTPIPPTKATIRVKRKSRKSLQ